MIIKIPFLSTNIFLYIKKHVPMAFEAYIPNTLDDFVFNTKRDTMITYIHGFEQIPIHFNSAVYTVKMNTPPLKKEEADIMRRLDVVWNAARDHITWGIEVLSLFSEYDLVSCFNFIRGHEGRSSPKRKVSKKSSPTFKYCIFLKFVVCERKDKPRLVSLQYFPRTSSITVAGVVLYEKLIHLIKLFIGMNPSVFDEGISFEIYPVNTKSQIQVKNNGRIIDFPKLKYAIRKSSGDSNKYAVVKIKNNSAKVSFEIIFPKYLCFQETHVFNQSWTTQNKITETEGKTMKVSFMIYFKSGKLCITCPNLDVRNIVLEEFLQIFESDDIYI